jgi:uncharacterized protein YbjT (DUF2867 family)
MRIAVAGGTGTVGRHVVDVATAQGHEAVALSRSTGIDLVSGAGLDSALAGVDVVIDVSGTATASGAEAIQFFGAVTSNLLEAESRAAVGHHVALSIIGAAQTNAAYYAGKKVQEDLVEAGTVPWTILRAAQFHEFVRQIIPQGKIGPLQLVPTMVSQPIAASEVAAVLVEVALAPAQGLAQDLAGPRVERMADLVRRYLRATGVSRPVVQVPLPGAWGRSLRDGSLLGGPTARLGTQTFDEWLGEHVVRSP